MDAIVLKGKKMKIEFVAKCGHSKGRRLLRQKNHFRLEEFTIPKGLLTEGKMYKVTIEEVKDGK